MYRYTESESSSLDKDIKNTQHRRFSFLWTARYSQKLYR